ncbi:MAG: extracellular solute-binding protein [Pseudomonadota bacterium]
MTAAADPVEIDLWRHEAEVVELTASLEAVDRFNAEQDQWRFSVETLPQVTYTSAVTAAALAGQLPCVLDLDQPVVPNFAWSGHLRALDTILSTEQLDALSEGAKGTYKGAVYSVGQFEVVLVLFARKSELQRYGIRIATMESPYTADEFREALRLIKRESPEKFPLDLNAKDQGEWLPYGFSPWIQSAGGDLIDRNSYRRADGYINGDAAQAAARWYQSLFEERLAERKTFVDAQALIQGRAIFHYTGSWETNRYTQAFGDDLVIMPPPDFGNGPKAGAGSWHWGISSTCKHPDAAQAFLEFLLRPEEIAATSSARWQIPTTEAGATLTENYREGGKWRKLYEYSRSYAVKRPATPGYPKISAAFEKAMMDIRFGKNVEDALNVAADAIEFDVERNRGYGFSN